MAELGFELASELGADGVSPMLLASARTLTGWRVVLYTGTNPDDSQSWVWKREIPASCSSAVVPIAKAIPGVKSAVQAIYWGTTPGPWRSSDGSVTIDPETVPIPSVDQAARDSAATALTLAGSKTAVFYSALAPANPTGGYTLRAGDVWYNTDTQSGCPDFSCKGHAIDPATGLPAVNKLYAHRGLYWAHKWDGSSWKDAQRNAQIIAGEIAAGAIVTDKLDANAITAAKIATGALQTTNYTEDANGNPTAGAKLDHKGTALKVAKGNLQIGDVVWSDRLRYVASVTIADLATSATFALNDWTDGDTLVLFAVPYLSSGSPATNAYIITEVSGAVAQNVGGRNRWISGQLKIRAAPGTGTSISFHVLLMRV